MVGGLCFKHGEAGIILGAFGLCCAACGGRVTSPEMYFQCGRRFLSFQRIFIDFKIKIGHLVCRECLTSWHDALERGEKRTCSPCGIASTAIMNTSKCLTPYEGFTDIEKDKKKARDLQHIFEREPASGLNISEKKAWLQVYKTRSPQNRELVQYYPTQLTGRDILLLMSHVPIMDWTTHIYSAEAQSWERVIVLIPDQKYIVIWRSDII